MHEFFCVGHHAPEGLTDGLVSQAHPQNGKLLREFPDSRLTHPGVRRAAGAGGYNQVTWGFFPDVRHRHLVIAHHLDVRAEAPHQLVQIVGKAVVIVDEQNHRSLSFWASSRARTTAFALLMHS